MEESYQLCDQNLSSDLKEYLENLPPCYTNMKTRLLDYDPQNGITIAVPVMKSYLNPAGSMQGGLISAAFDNAFGPLCLLTTRTQNTAALNIATTYHRPIFYGDELVITAQVKSLGKSTVYMIAEGYNQKGKLVASSTSTYFIKKTPG